MISNKVLTKSLKLINFNNIVYKQFKKPKRNTKAMLPSKFNKKLTINSFNFEGFNIITASSKEANKKHLIFLHGGAYLIEATAQHRKIIEEFAIKHNFKVSFIDYPKAPENTFTTTHRVMLKAYLELIKLYPNDEFYLFGDSAGGGLALSFLQQLISKDYPLPLKTVLVSPWIDASMENEEIKHFEKLDPILSVEGLRYAGEKYAGNIAEMKNPMVSPIYGELSNLGIISIYVGTSDILNPDCVKFAKMANSKTGTNVTLNIEPKMLHDWIVFPIKESKETIRAIAELIIE